MQVKQIDRDAAASGYYAWCSGNPVIPERMVAGTADDHSMVQAFARHRQAAHEQVVGEIVAWLLSDGSRIDYEESGSTEFFGWWAADKIEAKFGGGNGQRNKD